MTAHAGNDSRISVLPFVQDGPLGPALWVIPLREFAEFRQRFLCTLSKSPSTSKFLVDNTSLLPDSFLL